MDTQKVETRSLSDDQLDAVSGGTPVQEEAKRAWEWVRLTQEMLKELP